MLLQLKRIFKGATYTIGRLYIDGKYFCDTLEDKVRELPAYCPNTPKGLNCECPEKVYSKTAIPSGELTSDRQKGNMNYGNCFNRIITPNVAVT